MLECEGNLYDDISKNGIDGMVMLKEKVIGVRLGS